MTDDTLWPAGTHVERQHLVEHIPDLEFVDHRSDDGKVGERRRFDAEIGRQHARLLGQALPITSFLPSVQRE